MLGLTIFFELMNRRINKNKETIDYIDKYENFYLNGDEANIEPIEVCSLL